LWVPGKSGQSPRPGSCSSLKTKRAKDQPVRFGTVVRHRPPKQRKVPGNTIQERRKSLSVVTPNSRLEMWTRQGVQPRRRRDRHTATPARVHWENLRQEYKEGAMAACDNVQTRSPAPGGTSEFPETDWSLDAFHEMAELQEQVSRVATQDITVLLTGETGTGKTRLARLIHDLSPRRAEPFLVVDCGALSANLIESELFGHVKGAFTGAERDRIGKLAAAGKGTLLLDEINSLPVCLQAKLLRAVEDRLFEPVGANTPQPLRARLLSASNAPLDQEMAAGRFRPDLYYRLNVVAFSLAPLRDRRRVIPGLALAFLHELAAHNRPDVRGLAPAAEAALEEYSWPGNIRELRNVMERAIALCRGPDVELRDLPEIVRRAPPAQIPEGQQADVPALPEPRPRPRGSPDNAPLTLTQSREEAESRRIKVALDKNGNNRLRTAAELGISRVGLYKKLHKYRLIDA
jgi:DNA-binding NtrC family response regulator